MKEIEHNTDLCIIGGGISGVCAAISAARHNVKVVLMQDRPVLGGNASSEIRMWICGAHGKDNRETGILEELELENLYRNPESNYHIWDSVLYEKVKAEKNIKLLLNCTCIECDVADNNIVSVRGWQLTSETYHKIKAKLFADCSGDSILAPLSGAEYRIGREASSEFDESIEPPEADTKTMGMSILFQIRETDSPKIFIPPAFAYRYENDDAFPFKKLSMREHDKTTNFWWIELGGENDSIHDTENIKDELLKISFGIWDHMKNHGDHDMENWVLEWIGFLPGKRESRRYIGDYIMTQNDVLAKGMFDDIVAYGGWSMDDHHPAGFMYDGNPTIFHPAPSPYGIPYRCLYSKNIENLFMAGRNISVTHAALSSTRVMGTCSTLGQAVGTAAYIAITEGITPREVYVNKLQQLKQQLMDDDCYLPFNIRPVSELTLKAKISSSDSKDAPEIVRNGHDRPVNDQKNLWTGELGSSIIFEFDKPEQITGIRIIFDSNLNRNFRNMPCFYPLDAKQRAVPETLIKEFLIETSDDGKTYIENFHETNNYQRHINKKINISNRLIKITFLKTWGHTNVNVFSIDLFSD